LIFAYRTMSFPARYHIPASGIVSSSALRIMTCLLLRKTVTLAGLTVNLAGQRGGLTYVASASPLAGFYTPRRGSVRTSWSPRRCRQQETEPVQPPATRPGQAGWRGGLAAGVAQWFGREPVLEFVDWAEFERRVDPEHAAATREHTFRSITASIARAREVLGYAPRYSSLDDLHEALAWLVARNRDTVAEPNRSQKLSEGRP
jgi:hypothetical protein